jgi:hypothetical protein
MTPSASTAPTQEKLAQLADAYALTVEELLEEYGNDSVVPGICMNPECDYTGEFEPDQREGWCGVCETNTVASLLVLLGVI